MADVSKMVSDSIELVIGFFVLGIILSALLFPTATQWQNMVFENASLECPAGNETGYYLDAPGTEADIPINYGIYVVFSNAFLFMTLGIMLIMIGVILSFLKWKK